MQRRRISADIVTNPSASERKHYTKHHDSAIASHGLLHGTFPPQPSQRWHHTLLDKGTVAAVTSLSSFSASSTSSTTASPSHGHVKGLHLHAIMPATCSDMSTTAHSMESLSSDALPLGISLPSQVYKGNASPVTAADPATLAFRYPSPAYSGVSVDSASSVSLDACINMPVDIITPSEESAPCSPPKLAKETAVQYSYVDSLVDVATMITNSLWPCPDALTSRKTEHSVRMLSYFITETSRKSKTSLSTMQLALLYCIRFKRDQLVLKKLMDEHNSVYDSSADAGTASVGSTCARRNFLSALILASKYLQDRNFSNKAWSKISSVTVAEINLREREFLEITKWNLDVKRDVFKDWSSAMEVFTLDVRHSTMFGDVDVCQRRWKATVGRLISSTDPAISATIARIADDKRTYFETAMITPAATPSDELSHFCVPQIPVPVTPASSSPEVVLDAVAQAPITSSCPFFDEFIIQSTPVDSFLTLRTDAAQGPEMHYLTPESMRTASPSLSGSESHCQSPITSGIHQGEVIQPVPFKGHNLEEFLGEFLHVPSTPAIRPFESFSILASENVPAEFAIQTKRKRDTEVDGMQHCKGTGLALGKRIKMAF